MKIAQQLFVELFTLFEYISFAIVVMGRKPKRRKPDKRLFFVLAAVGVYAVFLFAGADRIIVFLVFQLVIVSTFCLVFDITGKELVKMEVLSFLVLCMLETMITLSMEQFGVSDGRFLHIVLCLVLLVGALWVYYALIGCKSNASPLRLPIKIWVLVILLLGLFLCLLTYFRYLTRSALSPEMEKYGTYGTLLSIFTGVAAALLIHLLLYYFRKTKHYQMQERISHKYNEQQKEYFTKLLEKERRTRKLYHDMGNHFLALESLCRKNDYGGVERYLKELLADFGKVSKSQYDVGNEIVNTIINYYFLPLEPDVSVKVRGFLGELETVAQKDLCILVSNLASNAVEAVEGIKDAKIELSIRVGQQYVSVEMENSYAGTIHFDKSGRPRTTKGDPQHHGWGLMNVQEIIEKYHGDSRYSAKNQVFKTELYLKY